MEAFGGLLGFHKGLVEEVLADPNQMSDVSNPSASKIKKAEEDACKVVKMVLLIRRLDRCQNSKLKDKLANYKSVSDGPIPQHL